MRSGLSLLLLVSQAAVALAEPQLPAPAQDADYFPVQMDEALLGRDLFFDPILSGNRTVACATCHHPKFATADGVSLSIGDGGIGLGPARRIDPNDPPEKRIPRNAPALFNLGAREFTVMFHDGRLEADPNHPNGIRTPMDGDMTAGFASVLSAQTMFPVLSRDEMAGSWDENEIAKAVRQGRITGPGGAWDLLSARVASVPEYADRFVEVYPEIAAGRPIAFTDISNAIAAFMAFEWRSDTAPFDAYLRGDTDALSPRQMGGMALFYGDAGCSACHSGPFQTDHSFHPMAAPQIGPGKALDFETHQRDEGRFRVTGRDEDRFAFRTPSLRNVVRTGPYGHAGSHRDLARFVADHADAEAALSRYDPAQALLIAPTEADFAPLADDRMQAEIAAAVRAPARPLGADELEAILAFLDALTDPAAIEGRLGTPARLPSGLPIP